MADYDISCSRLTDLTTAYLEDALDARVRTTFEQHVLFCGPCSAHIDQLRVTSAVLADLDPMPPERLSAIAEALGGP